MLEKDYERLLKYLNYQRVYHNMYITCTVKPLISALPLLSAPSNKRPLQRGALIKNYVPERGRLMEIA